MGFHPPKHEPAKQAEIDEAQALFGDLLGRLDKASGPFNASSSGPDISAQPKPARSGLFGWLKKMSGPA